MQEVSLSELDNKKHDAPSVDQVGGIWLLRVLIIPTFVVLVLRTCVRHCSASLMELSISFVDYTRKDLMQNRSSCVFLV